GSKRRTSSDSPLLDSTITASPFMKTPESPCAASAACRKRAGVPVLVRVAAIFRHMMPDLPIPVTTTLPVHAANRSMARPKRPSRRAPKAAIALASIDSTRRARRTSSLSRARRTVGGRLAFLGNGIDLLQFAQQRFELVETIRIGPVTERVVRILMHFQEHCIHPGSHCGTSQRTTELPLATRNRP